LNGLELTNFRALTFDCYGTLIDWESGILAALAPVRNRSELECSDDEVLEEYGRLESGAQKGRYRRYREVLCDVTRGMAGFLEVGPGQYDENALAESIADWKPFPDTVEALRRLKESFKLAIVSNIDDDLFLFSAGQLAVEFDHVITAEQVRSYKPSHDNFIRAIERIGLPREQILHVAQSLYHDIAPANELGLANVWVNRRQDRPGFGATHPADARPTLEVPDLAALARLV